MERAVSGQSETDLHLEKARAGLREMNEWALAHGPSETGAGRGIYGSAVAVMNELDAVLRILTSAEEEHEEEPKIPCPFCRRLTARKATRCGFCWKRLGETAR
jgi:hypothetical protein